jgi:hypothetical protein
VERGQGRQGSSLWRINLQIGGVVPFAILPLFLRPVISDPLKRLLRLLGARDPNLIPGVVAPNFAAVWMSQRDPKTSSNPAATTNLGDLFGHVHLVFMLRVAMVTAKGPQFALALRLTCGRRAVFATLGEFCLSLPMKP